MLVEIKIDLKLVRARTPLKALADVTLRFGDCDVTVRRCPIFEKSGALPWASLPRLAVPRNGEAHLAPIIELGSGLTRRVLDAILERYANRPR